MTRIHELAGLGQAVWVDYIRRAFLESGELRDLVAQGVRGVTSNPAIFEKAIAGSADYDVDLERLVRRGLTVEEIYEDLALEDIRRAAHDLRRVHDETGGTDGYVSIEVSPALAHDTAGTVAEARRLFGTLAQPNVMIKVPATAAGITAVEALVAEGINVNVTLIFSVACYEAVAEAYLRGLERRVRSGGKAEGVASVASFFVSRLDTAADPELERRGRSELCGCLANDNAKVAYARFREIFRGPRWTRLAETGARVQRLLWASTGTKNPAFSDTLYVDNLIGPDTVNTLPPATLQAFLDHGRVARTIDESVEVSRARLAAAGALGMDLEALTRRLQDEGLASFAKAFETLLASIREKRERLAAHRPPVTLRLGSHRAAVDGALRDLKGERVLARIWAKDHTVWRPDPREIADRLGWLSVVPEMQALGAEFRAFAEKLAAEGFTHALLLGMGGSSLAPEVFRKTFGVAPGGLDLAVLDSTDPSSVLGWADCLDPRRTLFIVSTKSGGTVETNSFLKFFYGRALEALGRAEAGRHFVAITDPGSGLASTARDLGFRRTFLNDPDIGGRYSALSSFGLVPAALVGVDLDLLLGRALEAVENAEACNCALDGDNHAARVGAALGELALRGRDKATFVLSDGVAGFGDWVEQLIAESTGKDGTGILPVVGEPLGPPEAYGDDRVFVHLALAGDGSRDEALRALERAGHPVVRVELRDAADLGAQFFLWEMATAVAGWRMGIHPFDQPDVEAAKVAAREALAAYRAAGRLPEEAPTMAAEGVELHGDVDGRGPSEALAGFLGRAAAGGYVAVQAYLPPSPETDRTLTTLRVALRARTGLATTVGYGPRFLHSTGQLHKGDAGRGVFLQLTADPPRDAGIPDEPGSTRASVTFGTLEAAQAAGDRSALAGRGREVLRVHLGRDVPAGLDKLRAWVG